MRTKLSVLPSLGDRLGWLVLPLLCLPIAAFAQNNSWTNPGDGFWQDATNWSAGAPSSTQLGLFITNAGTKTVTINATTTNAPGTMSVSNLLVSGVSGALNTLSLSSAGFDVPLQIIRGLNIGTNGSLLIDGSALAMVGTTASAFTNNGTVFVQNGGLLTITNSVIGSLAGRTGTLSIVSSSLTNLGTFTVGSVAGTVGNVVLSNSSSLFSGGVVTVGTLPGAGGNLASMTIYGGTSLFNSANLVVGLNASGRFPTSSVVVTGGALVSMTNIVNSSITVSSRGSSELIVSDGTVITFSVTAGNSASSVGRITVESNGNLLAPLGNGFLRIGDNANSTGFVTLAGGTINIRDGVEMGRSGFGQLVISNGTFLQTAPSGGGVATFVGMESASGYGVLKMFGGTTTLSAPVLIANAGNSTGIVEMAGGNWTANRNVTVGNAGYGEINISGGTSTLATVAGTTLTVGNQDGSRGTVNMSNGLLSILSHTVIGQSGTGSVNVVNGTINVVSNVLMGTNVSAVGTLALSGGAMTITNVENTATLDLRRGSLTLDGGTLSVDRLLVTNSGLGLVNFNAGTLNTESSVVANTASFIVGDGSSAATLTLVRGNHSFADGISVSSNATLMGTGTIVNSTLTIDNGGTLSPGMSPGTLTVSNLALSGGSLLDFELGPHAAGGLGFIGGGTNDLVVVTGDLMLDGILNVTALTNFDTFGVGPAATNVYRLFNYAGSFTDNGLDIGLLPSYAQGFIDTSTSGQVNLLVTLAPIPEPGAFALGAIGAVVVGLLRRKPRR